MILKIRAANPATDNSWRFFDGVTNLHYNIYEADVFAKMPPDDRTETDGIQFVQFWDSVIPLYVALLTFDSATTGPIEITCNTTVYLLNDQGKTIEKLI